MKRYKTSEAQWTKLYNKYEALGGLEQIEGKYIHGDRLTEKEFREVYTQAKEAGETNIVEQIISNERVVSYDEARKIIIKLGEDDNGKVTRQQIYEITSGDRWYHKVGSSWTWGNYDVSRTGGATPFQAFFAWLGDKGIADDIAMDYGY